MSRERTNNVLLLVVVVVEYKEKYVYLIAGATMYDFPVIT